MTEQSFDEYYRHIFENSHDAMLITHPDGNIVLANQAACTMFQRDREELYTVGCKGLRDMSDLRWGNILDHITETNTVKNELYFVRKDGSKFPAELDICAFQDEKGGPCATLVIRDITLLKIREENFRKDYEEAIRLATYDFLTNVYNRRTFMLRLQQEIERCKRKSTDTGLIMVDIDGFKSINDNYGHLAGDNVLRQFADCMSGNMRSYDVLARFGGDEFIIYLPSTSSQDSLVVAERLRYKLEILALHYNDHSIKLTASFGVTCYNRKSGEEINTFISRADNALYQAKRENNAVFSL